MRSRLPVVFIGKYEKALKTGQYLAVCGSTRALGNWDPKKAIKAEEFPRNSGNWVAKVHIPVDQNVLQWRWMIGSWQNKDEVEWEDTEERESIVPSDCEKSVIVSSYGQKLEKMTHSEMVKPGLY